MHLSLLSSKLRTMLCRYRFLILLIFASLWKRNSTQFFGLNSFDLFTNLVSSTLTHCHFQIDKTVTHRTSFYNCVTAKSDCSNRVCLNPLTTHDCSQDFRPTGCDRSDHDFTVSVPVCKSSFEKKPRISSKYFLVVSIDARENFFQDFERRRMKSPFRIQFHLDLSGLNTLHKIKIIMGAVKAIHHYKKKRGWVLIRSSVKRTELQEYLTQESLQTLSFNTMWTNQGGRDSSYACQHLRNECYQNLSG